MTLLVESEREHDNEIADNKQSLRYFRDGILNQKPDDAHVSLVDAYIHLRSIVEKLIVDNANMWQLLKQHKITSMDAVPEDTDLTNEQIRELLLKEINVGDIFYPSDFANEHGLDLMLVMDVVDSLRNEGKLINSPE